MIVNDKIEITINNRNKKRLSEIYKMNFKIGDCYIIDIKYLSKGSHLKIKCKCDYCSNIKELSYKDYIKTTNDLKDKYACKTCFSLKVKENNIKKYGVESTFQIKEVKDKIKDTLKSKYNVDHVSNIEYVKKEKELKWEQNKDEIIINIKKSWKGKSKEEIEHINSKRIKTLKDEFNVDNISQLDVIKKKKEETSVKNFKGVGFSSNIIREKIKNTIQEKYGVDNIMFDNEIKEKVHNILIKKYGGIGFSSDFIKDKINKSIFEKYGYKNIMWSEEFRKENFLISQDKNYINYISKKISLFKCDCGKEHFFKIDTYNYFKRKSRKDPLCTNCFPISKQFSIKEKMLLKFIKENYNGNIIENYRDGKEIDIYLPELKIGFEFNGIYWHTDKYVENNYHVNKLEYFKSKNIRIYYIWEDDWDFKNDIIKSQILNWIGLSKNKLYARNCKIKEIKNSKIVSNFLNENHIQGKVRSTLKLGLYYKDEIVSIMTFDHFEGRKKMNNDEWNLSRFCSKLNFNIIGGASKLISYLISNYNPKRIITYADYEWSDGKLYETLKFKLLYKSKITYKYVYNGIRVNKQRFKKSNLIKKGFSSKMTESQIMENLNISKIYDCGQLKYEIII